MIPPELTRRHHNERATTARSPPSVEVRVASLGVTVRSRSRSRRRRRQRYALAATLLLAAAATVVGGLWIDQSRITAAGSEATAESSPTNTERETPAALFVGDSYTEGTGAGDPAHGYACLSAMAMGWRCNLDTQGGTGYINDGSSNSADFAPFRERLRDDARRFYADIVIIDGGRNDGSYPVADVVRAADSYLHEVRSLWPDSVIVVMSPSYVWTTPENYGFGTQLANGIRPVLDEIGGHLIDPLGERWIAPDQVDDFLWTDEIHPNIAAHRYLSERLTEAFLREGLASLKVTHRQPSTAASATPSPHG